jgi:hypothetical protein
MSMASLGAGFELVLADALVRDWVAVVMSAPW